MKINPGVRITKTTLAKLVPPDQGQQFYRDDELRGFCVRVTASGHKSFVLEKRVNGRVRRITLGHTSELTVVQARNSAQRLLDEIAMGEDPVQKRRRAKAREVKLIDAYNEYLKSRRRLSPTTLDDYNRAINIIFKDWRSQPIRAITGDMVITRHRRIAGERGENSANKYMRTLRAIFNYAIDRYDDGSGNPIISNNPVLILTRTRSWYPSERRQTVIKPQQLANWYHGVQSLRNHEHAQQMGDVFADFLMLIAFTGLRRREAATLRWADVDLTQRSFTVTKTKNKRPHTLPFSDYLNALFIRRLGARQNDYVFPGAGGHGHLIEPKRQVKHVVAVSGVPFTIHDLRRTFLTIADALELSPYTIKRLANHSTNGDATAGYIISDTERLRGAMDRIEKFLMAAMQIDPPGKIVLIDRLLRKEPEALV